MPMSSSFSSPDRFGDRKSQQQKKKRVGKACDSCRLKKTKCSGKQPCEKCQADNKICIYTERKKCRDKSYSYDYVELIEKRLRLVNRALIKLSEMVKLQNTVELDQFAENLTYNEYDESVPISINQAISLLIDKSDIVDHSDNETSPEQGSLRKSSSHDDTFDDHPVKKDEVPQPSFVPYSSPESITPRSDEPFSPLPNVATTDSNTDFMINTHSTSGRLDDIKEEEKDDEFFSPLSPLPSDLFLNAINAPTARAESFDDLQSGAPSSVDLNGSSSGHRLASSALNGLLGSHRSSSGFLMSDFDLNSPASMLGTSPDSTYNSKTMVINPMNLSRNDSSYSSYFGEDSYLDSVHPPSNLQRSASTRSSDSTNRKHSNQHRHHHTYSQHPHPYKKNDPNTVESALIVPALKDEFLGIN